MVIQLNNHTNGKMTFMHENLGCNSGYLSPREILSLGYNFIETSINKPLYDEGIVKRMLGDLDEAKELGMSYAIHLPIFLSDYWQSHYDCYDAFYLDPDAEKRELSFGMLEENLIRLTSDYQPMYFVIHFPGIYDSETSYSDDFNLILEEGLNRLELLGQKYGCVIALEYFATNSRFTPYQLWIEKTKGLARVALLLDTGHLYFACYKHHFDYDEVLRGLAPHCIGFHVWNVRGTGYYNESESYKAYRHIVPHLEQTRVAGWAFTTEKLIPFLGTFNKPILVEASQRYKGMDYYKEGLVQIRELLRNDE